MDGHHLGMHREWDIGIVAAATHALKGRKDPSLLAVFTGDLGLVLRFLLLVLLLELANGRSIQCTSGEAASPEGASVESWTIVVETLTDDFTSADDDAAMLVVEWRLCSLLEAQVEIIIGLHSVKS